MDEKSEDVKKGAEKLWEATRKKFQTASFQASRYKKLVRKKIDLASLQKKIDGVHAELGKIVDEARATAEKDLLASEKVQILFAKLDELKKDALALTAEIEKLKEETSSEELPPEQG